MKFSYAPLLAVLLTPGVQQLHAQTNGDTKQVIRTFRLALASYQDQENIRTILLNSFPPEMRMNLLLSQSLIVVRGTPDQVEQVAEILGQFDHLRKQYRLTYTLTETEAGKRVGVQRYTMVVTSGERMQMKEGSRVPIVTGSTTSSDQTTNKQATYLDIGLNFDSTVQEHGSGVQLKSHIEQSSLALEKSGVGPEDPVIRQTRVEGTSFLTEGKPLSLGALDVISSTRRLEVEALIEAIR